MSIAVRFVRKPTRPRRRFEHLLEWNASCCPIDMRLLSLRSSAFALVGGLQLLSACKRADPQPVTLTSATASPAASSAAPAVTPTSTGPATTKNCEIVTPSDVSAALGVPVEAHPYDPGMGAGSTCGGNFTALDQRSTPSMVLMVQDYADASLFEHPERLHLDTFTPVEERPSVGAEAKLFVSKTLVDPTMKSLILRKNGKVFVLQTFNDLGKYGHGPVQFTKAQLLALAKVVAARM